MEKLNIISNKGNTYNAKIELIFDDINHNHTHITVRLFNNKNKLFRNKYNFFYSKSYYVNDIEFKDYKKAIEKTIYDYENSHEFSTLENHSDNIKKLKKWNGLIK